jgi:aspartokinase
VRGVTDKIVYAIGATKTEASFNPSRFVENLLNEHLSMLPPAEPLSDLQNEFQKLEHVLNYIRSSGELSDSVYAYTISRGENFATKILGYHLNSAGIKCHNFYGEDLIVTDDNNREASVDLNKTKCKVVENLLPYIDDGYVPIIAGFAGRSESGLITVLGRGGTDDTAACIAYCIGVKKLIKYVDEGGIMTLDPKFVNEIKNNETITKKVGPIPEARLIPYMNYVEASELLREERTKVVHFKVLNPLMNGKILLQLKSIDSEENEGTIIGYENGDNYGSIEGRPKAISFQRNLYGVRFLPSQSSLPTEVYAKVFESLVKANVDVRYLTISGYQISLLLPKQDVENALNALSSLDSKVEVKPIEGVKGTFSIIGSGMRGVKGFLSKITGIIARHDINIEQATQPYGENIIRFSVKDEDIPLAVAAVYTDLFKE